MPLSSYLNLSISSYFAVHDEITFRWSQEVAAVGNILITELITNWIAPSDTAGHLGMNAKSDYKKGRIQIEVQYGNVAASFNPLMDRVS